MSNEQGFYQEMKAHKKEVKAKNLAEFKKLVEGKIILTSPSVGCYKLIRGWDKIDIWPTTIKTRYKGKISQFETIKELVDFLLK